jgi:type IV pilus biogenesis protein PilP
MMSRIPRAPYIRTALTACAIAFVFTVMALVRAVRITPVEASEAPATAGVVRGLALPPVPDIDVQAVADNDIFQPDRTALPERYRMPGDAVPTVAGPAPEIPKPMVLGTVLSTDGSHFATCQLPGGRPTVVHVGDRLGDYTVAAIERDKVVFKTPSGARLEITAIRPGRQP